MSDQYTLYGAELSLYSGKVRAYLRKKGLSFNEVAANIKVYRKIIIPKTGVSYIPVVQTPQGEYLQDTSIIIERIEAAHPDLAHQSVTPIGPGQRLIAELLEVYADEWLLIPAMHYRWDFPKQNQPFIYQEFGRFVAPWAPALLRGWFGKKAGEQFRGAVGRLGITEKTIPEVEASYLALLNDLEAHFAQHDFLLGSKPCIADFGFIGPMYAHLYRDPAPGALMRERNPKVAAWVERMIDEQAYLTQGCLLADDQIPETLEPIIQRMGVEQMPVLQATNQLLKDWREHKSDAKLANTPVPRFIGEHDFTLGDVTDKRVVLPYSLWMLQRALERSPITELRSNQDFVDWLAKMNLSGILGFEVAEPMRRVDNKLTFANAQS